MLMSKNSRQPKKKKKERKKVGKRTILAQLQAQQ